MRHLFPVLIMILAVTAPAAAQDVRGLEVCTAEKAMVMAKESLMDPIDMQELKARAAEGQTLSKLEALRIELHDKINQSLRYLPQF